MMRRKKQKGRERVVVWLGCNERKDWISKMCGMNAGTLAHYRGKESKEMVDDEE